MLELEGIVVFPDSMFLFERAETTSKTHHLKIYFEDIKLLNPSLTFDFSLHASGKYISIFFINLEFDCWLNNPKLDFWIFLTLEDFSSLSDSIPWFHDEQRSLRSQTWGVFFFESV